MTARALATILTLAVFTAAGCGGDGGVDTEDPDAVAEALARASFKCGEEGAGVVHDLTIAADRDFASREEALSEQRADPCSPQAVPETLQVSLADQRGDYRLYRFQPAPSEDLSRQVPGELTAGVIRLVSTNDGWRYTPEADE